MTLQEKNDIELIQRFHDEFADIAEATEPTDDALDRIEENYSEELFEDIDDILEELSEIFR
jgi:hypothetical protein|tara:strand:- start:634 stop:816 length:183 start_codon:yes stop_codon:yes gene_type:complete